MNRSAHVPPVPPPEEAPRPAPRAPRAGGRTPPVTARAAARAVARAAVLGAFLLVGPAAALVPAALSAAEPALRAKDIAPFDVFYDVGNNLITAGSARLTLSRNGDDWFYTLSTKPTGVFKLTGKGRIRETSVLRIVPLDDAGEEGAVRLEPRRYAYRQDGEARRAVDAVFDWDKRTLTWRYRGERGTEKLADPSVEPVLDRLSVTLTVMNLLRRGFDEIELEVFDSGELKTMRFVNEGRETLDTEMGKVETIRVRGRNADGGSRSTKTWFAPSLDYVPVRLEQHKRDELVARMNLLKLRNRVTDIELVDPDSLDGEAGGGK